MEPPQVHTIIQKDEGFEEAGVLRFLNIYSLESIINGDPWKDAIELLNYNRLERQNRSQNSPSSAIAPMISIPQVCLDLFRTILKHTPIESRVEHKSTLLMALYSLSFPTMTAKNSKRHYVSMISGVLHRDSYQSSQSLKERLYFQIITPILRNSHTESVEKANELANTARASKIQDIYQYLCSYQYTEPTSKWTHISRALVMCDN